MPATTLLAFLTTSCLPCRPLWEALGDPATRQVLASLGVGLAVVTPSRSMEDERAVGRLAPPGAQVHMASEAWFSYGVNQAGTLVLVRQPPGGEAPWEKASEVLGSAGPPASALVADLVRSWLTGQA